MKIISILLGLILLLGTIGIARPDYVTVPLGVPGTIYEGFRVGAHGGTLRSAMIANPVVFNPIVARDTASFWPLARLQNSLIIRNPLTMEIEPSLATHWEVAADGLSIIFHLRRGIRWSDGEPLTADDLMFTFVDVFLNTDIDARRVDWTLPDGTLPWFTKIDDYTIKVHFNMTFRPALIAVGGIGILPRHKLWHTVARLNPALGGVCGFNHAWGVGTDPAEIVGTGPFVLYRFIPDVEIRMKRNPNFWKFDPAGNRLPYWDMVVTNIVASIDVAFLMFRNKELDVFGPRAEDLAILKAEAPIKGFTLLITEDLAWGQEFVTVNQDHPDPRLRELFRDLRFREALAHAADTETMIDVVHLGLARSIWSPVSVNSPFYAGWDHPDIRWREYSLDTAAALLDEIGIIDTDGDGWREFADGTRVAFRWFTNAGNELRITKSLIMKDSLRELGLYVTFTGLPWPEFVGRLLAASGDWDAIVVGFTAGVDPHGAGIIWRSIGGLQFWRFSAGGPGGRHPAAFPVADPAPWNARVDELWDLQAGTFDDAEAKEYFAEFQLLINEHLPLVYLPSGQFDFAFYNHLGNFGWSNINGTGSDPWGVVTSFDLRQLP
ncbi:ABC transporter substrate-binding protein [Candidatus Acetothermia bacterium]|nr:ABC transporter substrate-binding protein [Candidatus Acetothermia bacterium]MCI2428722.1 ABC transporter substrate-binding protein [Candidatus Acetothermia bacterium]